MDINKYQSEITYILGEINNLQVGNFYESLEQKGTPSVQTIAVNLKNSFVQLLDKIEQEQI